MFEDLNAPIGRRSLLAGAAATAGAAVLAGCGGSGSTSGSGTQAGSAAPSGPRKRGGTLRVVDQSLTQASSVDPNGTQISYATIAACFAPLVAFNPNMEIVPWLAETFEPDDNTFKTWTIRLRKGLEWHDGKPVTADDVIFTIKRILNPKAPGTAAVLMAAVDAEHGLTKVDAQTVKLKLKSANSQLRRPFAAVYSALVPVGFDPQHPIGCGPFKQVSFTPQQRWSGVKFDNYFEAGKPYLDGVELLGFASSTAAVNAVESGQADGMDRLLPASLPAIKQRSDLNVVISPTGMFQTFSMNTGKGQMFEDPRVRQAFKLMTNRQQLVDEIFQNYGYTGNDVGVWPQWDPACSPSLPKPQFDVEQAKSLLKAAGKSGMTVPLRTGELEPGMTEAATIFIQQAQAAGVTIKLNTVTDLTTYYSKAFFTAPLQTYSDETEDMYGICSYYFLSTAAYNISGYNNPKVDSLYTSALASDESGYRAKMHEVSHILATDGPWIVWGRQDSIDVLNNKFTGLEKDASADGFGGWRLQNISLA